MPDDPVYTEEEMDAVKATLDDRDAKIEELVDKINALKAAIEEVASAAHSDGLQTTLDAIADAENLANKTRA